MIISGNPQPDFAKIWRPPQGKPMLGNGCWIDRGNLTCPVESRQASNLCLIMWETGFMARGPVSGTDSTTSTVNRQLSRQTARLLAARTVFTSINNWKELNGKTCTIKDYRNLNRSQWMFYNCVHAEMYDSRILDIKDEQDK
jgi:hypothetical protein